MAKRGGYQQPRNPAGVSGPGKLSRRTDGGPSQKLRDLPDAQYGEAATFKDLQHGAPLAQVPTPKARTSSAPAGPPAGIVPLTAPSQRPDEPVTAGADAGLGPGLNSIVSPAVQLQPTLASTLAQLQPYDVTGAIADLVAQAQHRGI